MAHQSIMGDQQCLCQQRRISRSPGGSTMTAAMAPAMPATMTATMTAAVAPTMTATNCQTPTHALFPVFVPVQAACSAGFLQSASPIFMGL
jgi:hypothetical protein